MATRRKRKNSSGSLSLFSTIFRDVVPKVLLFVFVAYAATMIVVNQVKINRLEASTKSTEELIVTGNIVKSQLEEELSDGMTPERIRKEAEGYGYASPNETIFKDVAGS